MTAVDRVAPIAEAAFDQVVSLAGQSGFFDRVNQHEATNAPGTGLTFAVWVQEVKPIALHSGLDATSARLTLQTRIYMTMFTEPADAIDITATKAATWMQAQYCGDFQIDGAFLDLQGAYGVDITAKAGYLSLDGKLYRVIDTQLPFIAADVWDQEA